MSQIQLLPQLAPDARNWELLGVVVSDSKLCGIHTRYKQNPKQESLTASVLKQTHKALKKKERKKERKKETHAHTNTPTHTKRYLLFMMIHTRRSFEPFESSDLLDTIFWPCRSQWMKHENCCRRFWVQFKKVSMRSAGKAYKLCALLPLSDVSPSFLWKRFQCSSDWQWPSLFLSRRSSSVYSFHAALLQAIDGVMSLFFAPAGSVPSFSTLQTFREASHLWGLLCLAVYMLGHFPSLQHVQGSQPTGVLEGGCLPLTHSSLGFPFPFSLFVAAHWICENDGVCGQTVVSWGSPEEGMGDGSHLHCQAGGWDSIGCTVFIDGSRTLFDSEAPPWLVFGDIHQCILCLAVCCFPEWKTWSLTPFCLMADLDSDIFSKFSGRSVSQRRRNRFGCLFPLLGLLVLGQLEYLQCCWVLCLTHPRLAPSQSAPRRVSSLSLLMSESLWLQP